MGIFDTLNISASGMTAQRLRNDVIAQNIANVNTTKGADGNPYRRRLVVMEEKQGTTSFANVLNENLHRPGTYHAGTGSGSGVKITKVYEDQSDLKKVYDPSHPDADGEGYVSYPNVDTVTEMTDMIDASRAFEANVTAFNATKAMALKGLELGK